MNKNASVTFVICTYNRANYLDNALKSLLKHKPHDLSFQLLVVDNNSSDQTPEVVKKYQQSFNKEDKSLRYIKETQQGISYARNCGIQETNTPYIVFLDDDIEASESLISAWIEFFSENPKALAAGGKIHVRFDDPKPKWMSHFLLPLFGRHDLGKTFKKYPSKKFPFAGNMGVKKSIFEEIGYFNTKYGQRGKKLYAKGEEKELSQRIRSITKDIYYLPDAFVYHHVDESRLTTEYVKEHAMGMGRSQKIRIKNESFREGLSERITEIEKWLVSIPLALGYLISFQPAKATMLIRFRWWIWKGYKDLK